ncbi:unnamed protein product, partial [Citrullus colocynthis]
MYYHSIATTEQKRNLCSCQFIYSSSFSTTQEQHHTMGFREVWLLLSIMLAMSSAAVDKQTYIIHMDTTKMVTANPEQWYKAMIDSVNELSSLDDNKEEASNSAEILYVYKTALS